MKRKRWHVSIILFVYLVVVTQTNLAVFYDETEETAEIISFEYRTRSDKGIEVVGPEPAGKKKIHRRFDTLPPPCILIEFWSC